MTIYRAILSGHHLWIIATGNGSWYLCITGKTPVQEDNAFESLDAAKLMAHTLAHWHIEGKGYCDCAGELCWESPSTAQTVGDIDDAAWRPKFQEFKSASAG